MIVDRRVRDIEEASRTHGTSQRSAALVAGISLLIMAVVAIFATFVHDSVLVPGNAATTADNMLANELQFRLAVLSFLLVVVLDVIVAWALYVFFRPVNRHLSLLAAWFRVVYAAVYLVVILDLGNALRLVRSADALVVLESEPLQAQVMMALNAFGDGWDFALAIFGLHLLVLGYLVFKASYAPRLLAALVVICGLGYVFDAVVGFLFPTFGVTVGQFTFIGELLLALWLVSKSARAKQWEKLVLASA
jgi:hypothetical protein